MKAFIINIFRNFFWISSILLFLLVFLLQIIVGKIYDILNALRMSIIQLKRKMIPPAGTLPRRKLQKKKRIRIKASKVLAVFSFLFLVGVVSYTYDRIRSYFTPPPIVPKELYLIDAASEYIPEKDQFEAGIKQLATKLDIPPEWLMAVIYMESRFNPAIENRRGSGAVGLIQFMVPAVKELNRKLGKKLFLSDIQNMPALEQLELIDSYLHTVRERRGDFKSLTDLYLAILYPKAVGRGLSYKLFSSPSRRYRQNSGLDENKDGTVSVSDIDMRMKKMFPTAYQIGKNDSSRVR